MFFYVIKDKTGDIVLSETMPANEADCLYRTPFVDLALRFIDAAKTSHNPIAARQTAIGLNAEGNNKRSQAIGLRRRAGGAGNCCNAYIDHSNLIVRDVSHIPARRIAGR